MVLKEYEKTELIEALSKELNLPQISTSALVETILDSMTKALVTGGNIELRGFGSFTIRQYESYTGRNPKTGKEFEVKAKRLPFFKVGKDLKEAVMLGGRKCPS
jgi:integration host factor subunit beta